MQSMRDGGHHKIDWFTTCGSKIAIVTTAWLITCKTPMADIKTKMDGNALPQHQHPLKCRNWRLPIWWHHRRTKTIHTHYRLIILLITRGAIITGQRPPGLKGAEFLLPPLSCSHQSKRLQQCAHAHTCNVRILTWKRLTKLIADWQS